MSRTQSGNIPKPYNLIQNERQNTNFDINEMFEYLEGNSAEKAKLTEDVSRFLERDLVLKNTEGIYDNATKKDIRKTTFLKVGQLASFLEQNVQEQRAKGIPFNKLDMAPYMKIFSLYPMHDSQTVTRLGIHSGLFYNAVRGNGTPEQYQYWAFEREGIYARNVYGCFGMTELAHGSNVASLETTAEYDFETKTFLVNTPHIGATKWWIGGAATTANHCVVYARLIVAGKDYGVKTFIVPLRDINHKLFPGVSVGDIGAKMGRDGIDNGWIQFTNVRIPKNFLLQKYVKIDDEEQEVLDSPMDQLAYGALLDGRVSMVTDSFRIAAKVLTTALRYAVGRRQFGKTEDPAKNFVLKAEVDSSLKLEKQIIDYPNHQYRLIPLLAQAYTLSTVSDRLFEIHEAVRNALDAPHLLTDQKFLFQTIEELKEVFVVSASAKANATWFGAKTIDEARQSCGGHGYSSYSGFGSTYNDWVVQCTWEGDNNVLSINSGRSIVKYRAAAKKGKPVPKSFAYLKNDHKLANIDFKDSDQLLKLFDLAINAQVDNVLEILPRFGGNYEKVGPNLKQISQFQYFRYNLESALLYFKANKGKTIKPVLSKVINLFANYVVRENASEFLRYDLISKQQLNDIDVNIFGELLPALRDQIIGLTDSFKLSDFFVNSALGGYDGDFYNKYFDLVNRNNNSGSDYDNSDYQDEIVKFLRRDSLPVREFGEKSPETLAKLGK